MSIMPFKHGWIFQLLIMFIIIVPAVWYFFDIMEERKDDDLIFDSNDRFFSPDGYKCLQYTVMDNYPRDEIPRSKTNLKMCRMNDYTLNFIRKHVVLMYHIIYSEETDIYHVYAYNGSGDNIEDDFSGKPFHLHFIVYPNNTIDVYNHHDRFVNELDLLFTNREKGVWDE